MYYVFNVTPFKVLNNLLLKQKLNNMALCTWLTPLNIKILMLNGISQLPMKYKDFLTQ